MMTRGNEVRFGKNCSRIATVNKMERAVVASLAPAVHWVDWAAVFGADRDFDARYVFRRGTAVGAPGGTARRRCATLPVPTSSLTHTTGQRPAVPRSTSTCCTARPSALHMQARRADRPEKCN